MSDLAELLERPIAAAADPALAAGLAGLAAAPRPARLPDDPRHAIEAIIAGIDARMAELLNLILHHPEFQRLEATWRGVWFLLDGIEGDPTLKVRVLDISKRELIRTLRKFRGTGWDQSPVFRKIYEEEYGQFGGEPFGVLVGDYEFDQSPQDVTLLGDLGRISATAHVPFIASASPTLMQMESWAELANPRDLTRIFQTVEYTGWRALRASEDARYIGLCLPRWLVRLPYGHRTEPTEAFDFEEDVEGPDASRYLWGNPALAMAANIARAFRLYGWCVRIRGIDGGGSVDGLPVSRFPTADGETDERCTTEVALSERREAELASIGFIPLVHRKHLAAPAFIAAPSIQQPQVYDDPAATANAALSARLPYMFATCRFAHYLKCMVRDKIGSAMDRVQIQQWLQSWLTSYIDGSPETSSEEWKAAHPLAEGVITVAAREDVPGTYEARFYLRPHYQLEGSTASIRLVSRLTQA